jgi:hypothetical protein
MDKEPMSASDAHRVEIMEGVLDAVLKGDVESFKALNAEWERIDPLGDDGPHIRFGDFGAMEQYLETGFCYHCQESWQVGGVRFGKAIPGLTQMIHMQMECTNSGDCTCWVGPDEGVDEGHPFGWPNCQRCGRADPICECDGEPSYGPCALVWKSDVTPSE